MIQQNGLYTIEEIDIQKNPAGLMEVADIDEVNLMASPLTGYARSIIDKINLVNNNILFQEIAEASDNIPNWINDIKRPSVFRR